MPPNEPRRSIARLHGVQVDGIEQRLQQRFDEERRRAMEDVRMQREFFPIERDLLVRLGFPDAPEPVPVPRTRFEIIDEWDS